LDKRQFFDANSKDTWLILLISYGGLDRIQGKTGRGNRVFPWYLQEVLPESPFLLLSTCLGGLLSPEAVQ
jgi:hypothetical protein